MRYVMWELNVKAHGFDDRLAAAVAGGFDTLTLSYRAFREAQAAGQAPEALARAARAEGIALDFLDGMTSWTPSRFVADAGPFMREAFDFTAEEAFELCDRTGIRNIVAVAGFAEHSLSVEQQTEYFADFCDEAATRGLEIHLEAMPILGGGIPTLADAWNIVSVVDRANVSLMFDSWHFMRRGADIDLLASIPRGRIKHIQLVDGLLLPQSADLWDDALHHREVPGGGDLPLLYLMGLLRRTQNIESLGPEAILDRLDAVAAVSAGCEVGRATEDIAIAAGFPARMKSGT